MWGTAIGNLLGVGYYLLFLAGGIGISWMVIKEKNVGTKILVGSVFGTICLQWLPLLAATVLGFSLGSHGIAAVLFGAILCGVWYFFGNQKNVKSKNAKKTEKMDRGDVLFCVLAGLLFLFFFYLLKTHTIPLDKDGNVMTGQCTYGDMNMHLAFITSIAKQGGFPPEYSILPGNNISYPFLCDSISSSIYLFGSSIRVAYILPMLIAFLQVMGGIYLIARYLFDSRAKGIVTWMLFLFDGGLGVLYFLPDQKGNFTRIFTEFYETPTNYVQENVHWTNILVDMLLPQRATLFGWALLFPTILLLAMALKEKKHRHMISAAILTGAMPMVHTHSFVAMAFICAMWLIASLKSQADAKWFEQNATLEKWIVVAGFVLLNVLSFIYMQKEGALSDKFLLGLGIADGVAITMVALWSLFKVFKAGDDKGKALIIQWGSFLGIVLVLALPQLLIWTFHQAQGEQFLRGGFNWANSYQKDGLEWSERFDQYTWFYLKNIGVMMVLAAVALYKANRRKVWLAAPAGFLWFVCEVVLFQPNTYDNNKLLDVAYFFVCLLVADFVVDQVTKIKAKWLAALVSVVSVFVLTISAVLTMGREAHSEYQLYSADEIAVCDYIEEMTEPEDTILTDTRHNNPVSSLTGRNIVCGSSSILYYHGLDYTQAEQDVSNMYANPGDTTLLDKYGVDYILVGNSERYNYSIQDDTAFASQYELVFQQGECSLYKVK